MAPNAEKKFFDLSNSSATSAIWNMLATNVCVPTQGTGNQNRIGQIVSVTAVNFRMFLQIAAAESAALPPPSILCRIIVGVNNGPGTTAVSDVVDEGSTTDLLSYRNIDGVTDITVLKDFYIRVDPWVTNEGAIDKFANGVKQGEVVKWTHVFKKPLQLRFDTASDNVAKNSIFLMAISSAAGATHKIEIRTRFTDS